MKRYGSLLPSWWCRLSLLSSLSMVGLLPVAYTGNTDRFNYRQNENTNSGIDYGPTEWSQVTCDDPDVCLGWPDAWELSRGWQLQGSGTCKYCPVSGNSCGVHHQSPINLIRGVAINGSDIANICIDIHWMKYEDSSCTYDQLVEMDAFTIDRHALKITQPIEATDEGWQIACRNQGKRWGKIDFSKGFSHWWFLSHIDFKVPSEHTQEGKRYSGEVQLAHFYSLTPEEAQVHNEMAHVSMFMEAYDDVPPWPFLDRAICAWRDVEDERRKSCDLPSVEDTYPGCFPYARRRLRRKKQGRRRPLVRKSALDILEEYHQNQHPHHPHGPKFNSTMRIRVDADNFDDARWTDDEWAEWAEEYSDNHRKATKMWRKEMTDWTEEQWEEWIESHSHDEELHESAKAHRNLLNYETQTFHNYMPLIDVKTEYYYRYHGTQTIPPCYGPYNRIKETMANRGFTNHWRVMKDPIRVHPRQIKELERLLKERVAAPNDPDFSCQTNTAAKIDENGRVSVARPLQSWSTGHFKVFCECEDWPSKWPEDRDWCRGREEEERFYDVPYNFDTGGQF